MSRTRMASHKKNLESESKTSSRKSTRLNNINSNYPKSKIISEREKITKQDNLKTYPVLTRSRARLPNCVGSPTVTDVHTAESSSSDSDVKIVRTLRYSESSDNNCNVSNKTIRSKVSNNNEKQNRSMDKKGIDDGQHFDKATAETMDNAMRRVTKGYNLRKRTPQAAGTGNGAQSSATLRHAGNKKCSNSRGGPRNVENDSQTTNNAVLKSVANRRSFNLQVRRSPRFAEGGNKTKNISEEKIITKKARETKEKGKKNEKDKKPSGVEKPLKTLSHVSPLSCDREKEVKKPKVRKKGTLARKRELRAMLEKQDEGYEDDAFEGTPFRNRRPLLNCKLSPVVLDTSIRSMSTSTDCKTPCSMTPANRLRPAGPYSPGTSENDITTPGLLSSFNRNDIDCYVNRLKRRKIHLGYNRKTQSHTPLSKKPRKVIQSKLWDIPGDYKHRKNESENCENTDDYYWSDVE